MNMAERIETPPFLTHFFSTLSVKGTCITYHSNLPKRSKNSPWILRRCKLFVSSEYTRKSYYRPVSDKVKVEL